MTTSAILPNFTKISKCYFHEFCHAFLLISTLYRKIRLIHRFLDDRWFLRNELIPYIFLDTTAISCCSSDTHRVPAYNRRSCSSDSQRAVPGSYRSAPCHVARLRGTLPTEVCTFCLKYFNDCGDIWVSTLHNLFSTISASRLVILTIKSSKGLWIQIFAHFLEKWQSLSWQHYCNRWGRKMILGTMEGWVTKAWGS